MVRHRDRRPLRRRERLLGNRAPSDLVEGHLKTCGDDQLLSAIIVRSNGSSLSTNSESPASGGITETQLTTRGKRLKATAGWSLAVGGGIAIGLMVGTSLDAINHKFSKWFHNTSYQISVTLANQQLTKREQWWIDTTEPTSQVPVFYNPNVTPPREFPGYPIGLRCLDAQPTQTAANITKAIDRVTVNSIMIGNQKFLIMYYYDPKNNLPCYEPAFDNEFH